jgi:putative ABC transport system permease protein
MSPLATFRRVSVPHLRAHPARTAITVAGIALGIAAVVGLRLAYEPISRSQEQALARLAGNARFQITNGELGVPEEVLEDIREIPGLGTASGSVQGFLPLADRAGERLYVLGVDLLADREVREYEFKVAAGAEDPLVFLARPDSVALTSHFLDELGRAVGDRIVVRGPSGPTALVVRAALEARAGPASLFAGRLALMDVFAAQRLFGLDRRFSRIDVTLAPGVDPGTVESRLLHSVAVSRLGQTDRVEFGQTDRVLGLHERRMLSGSAYPLTTRSRRARMGRSRGVRGRRCRRVPDRLTGRRERDGQSLV